jgi:hypothetical protein
MSGSYDWRVGDRFEVLGSLFEDPTLEHPGSYRWGTPASGEVLPQEGTRGKVVHHRDSGALGVVFDGLDPGAASKWPGWTARDVVFRHFRKIEERLHCAQCNAACEGIDYLCSSCRS